LIADVEAGLLLMAEADGRFVPAAVWPDASQGVGHLRHAAEEALRTRAGAVLPPPHESGATGLHVAYPIAGDQPALDKPARDQEQVLAVVVLDLLPRIDTEVQRVLRQLHWGAGWLEALLARTRLSGERDRIACAAAALDIVATAHEHDRLEAAAMAVTNELA